MPRIETQAAWEARTLAQLPARWAGRVARIFEKRKAHNLRAGNIWLRETVEPLHGCLIPLDATDGDVCAIAEREARRLFDALGAYQVADVRVTRARLAAAVARWRIVPPDGPGVTDGGAVARMLDALWWRRQLRAVHARDLEAGAIKLGFVHAGKGGGLYCSDETLKRRQGQKRRNAATLESVYAVNEADEAYSLAELAALSVANPAIRRGELMVRIRGFEEVARRRGDAGEFWTLTCPSRMHSRLNAGGALNPRYDGTNPRQAQQYLGKVWARIRAAWARADIAAYGVRVAEPHHDGTPHWHLLLFIAARHIAAARAIFRRYALADSPDEAGAATYRTKFVSIDPKRGTAAGYVAKYIAKNIDGYAVGRDLFGEDAIETSARVEAWASTWGIRQFQQFGGPTVGVWREVRRYRETVTESAPVEAARIAAGDTAAGVVPDWAKYVDVQGGPLVARQDARIRIQYGPGERINPNTGEIIDGARNRYGEPLAARIVGLLDAAAGVMVGAVRHVWRIVSRAGVALLPPWTCVNNCTGSKNERSGKGAGARFAGERAGGNGAIVAAVSDRGRADCRADSRSAANHAL